ncbi:MAG: hypothetical protein GY801_49950 [bacterium]|nr:hypothetical protein [bacterium]
MKKQHTTLKDAVQHDTDFLSFVAQQARAESSRIRRQKTEKGPHPTKEMLLEYVWDTLDADKRSILRKHLACCPHCSHLAWRLGAIRRETDGKLASWSNEVEISAAHAPARGELLDVPALEYWGPVGAGEALVAAGSVTQEHEFHTRAGLIKVVCAWGQTVGEEPAYIWLSWDADLQQDTSFVIRLLDPDTREMRYEIQPGAIRKGNQTFTQETLGFDPVGRKWAVSVATSGQNA